MMIGVITEKKDKRVILENMRSIKMHICVCFLIHYVLFKFD